MIRAFNIQTRALKSVNRGRVNKKEYLMELTKIKVCHDFKFFQILINTLYMPGFNYAPSYQPHYHF